MHNLQANRVKRDFKGDLEVDLFKSLGLDTEKKGLVVVFMYVLDSRCYMYCFNLIRVLFWLRFRFGGN